VVTNDGDRTGGDPYRAIDGGALSGGGYQACCNSRPWMETAAAMVIAPAIGTAWGPKSGVFAQYCRRWAAAGALAAPDECAPASGTCVSPVAAHNGTRCTGHWMATHGEPSGCGLLANGSFSGACRLSMAEYGVTFGYDNSSKSCIRNATLGGRFKDVNGTWPEGKGFYGGAFGLAMWNTYVGPVV